MSEPRLIYATVRESEGDIHIECRFDDGQKFAAIHVAEGFDRLASDICAALNHFYSAASISVPDYAKFGEVTGL